MQIKKVRLLQDNSSYFDEGELELDVNLSNSLDDDTIVDEFTSITEGLLYED